MDNIKSSHKTVSNGDAVLKDIETCKCEDVRILCGVLVQNTDYFFKGLFKDVYNILEIALDAERASKAKELIGKRISIVQEDIESSISSVVFRLTTEEGQSGNMPPMGTGRPPELEDR